jgi:hypothetical protein
MIVSLVFVATKASNLVLEGSTKIFRNISFEQNLIMKSLILTCDTKPHVNPQNLHRIITKLGHFEGKHANLEILQRDDDSDIIIQIYEIITEHVKKLQE